MPSEQNERDHRDPPCKPSAAAPGGVAHDGNREDVGRRRLLILGAAAASLPACSDPNPPLGGPYGGTAEVLPPPNNGSDGGAMVRGGGSGSGAGSGSGSGSSGGCAGGTGAGGEGGTGCPCNSSTYAVTFSQHAGLMNVGDGVTVQPPGYTDSWGNDSIYVLQSAAGQYVAYSLSCSHEGCLVSQSTTGWRCPCHGTTFTSTGTYIQGPGNANLQTYSVCADSAGVTITLM
jgi:nitrite reductase/ring-hydroxylating ferredoxin subunit